LLCPVCNDVIGVYEPLLVVDAESARTSSLAREPPLGSGHGVIIHRACGSRLGIASVDDGPPATIEQRLRNRW